MKESLVAAVFTFFPFGAAILLWVHHDTRGFLRFAYAAAWFAMGAVPIAVPLIAGMVFGGRIEDWHRIVMAFVVVFLEIIAIQAVVTAKLFLWSAEQSSSSEEQPVSEIDMDNYEQALVRRAHWTVPRIGAVALACVALMACFVRMDALGTLELVLWAACTVPGAIALYNVRRARDAAYGDVD